VTPAERALLRELVRWARTEGGMDYGSPVFMWTRRIGVPDEQWWGVTFYAREWEAGETARLDIWRWPDNTQGYWVRSVAEAVDVLVALGIAPARFSTAYRAGWDAMGRYAVQAHYGSDWTAIRPAAKRELVRPS
jgi:hypothetical protein